MSRAESLALVFASAFIVAGISFFVHSLKTAGISLILGFVIALGLYLRWHAAEEIDIWLGFSEDSWGPGSALLCIQNNGEKPIFNVVVCIPNGGPALQSDPISRLKEHSAVESCSLTKNQVVDAVLRAVIEIPRKTPGPISEYKLPVRINYTDSRGRARHFDGLEIHEPPFEIRRTPKSAVFDRLVFRKK